MSICPRTSSSHVSCDIKKLSDKNKVLTNSSSINDLATEQQFKISKECRERLSSTNNHVYNNRISISSLENGINKTQTQNFKNINSSSNINKKKTKLRVSFIDQISSDIKIAEYIDVISYKKYNRQTVFDQMLLQKKVVKNERCCFIY